VSAVTLSQLRNALAEMRTNSAVALGILDVCQRPEASAADLADAVEPDPSISLRVLRLANSPAFGARAEVSSVHDAVLRIGRNTTQSIAIEAALGADDGDSCPPNYWERSLLNAAASALCAREIGKVAPDAFSTGLLLDIGCYLLFRIAPEVYVDIIGANDGSHAALIELEERMVSLTHCEVGALALEELGLSKTMCEVIASHHRPPNADSDALLLVVTAGAALADLLLTADEADEDDERAVWLTTLVGPPDHHRNALQEHLESLAVGVG